MAEFADVAGPGMAEQPRLALGADRPAGDPVAAAELRKQLIGQLQDILPAIPQRRDDEAEQAQPVMQVVSELAVGHRLAKVAVAGGDDPNVDVDLPVAAESPDAFFLDRLEHLGLQAEREAGQFIKKKSAALGRLEQAHASRLGVGERAALVAEQFRLGETLRQRGAVNLDERPGGERPVVVQPAGDAGFAGAGFALEQHRRQVAAKPLVCGDDLVELTAERAKRVAEKKPLAGGVGIVPVVLGQPGGLSAGPGAVQHERQHGGIDRLEEIVLRAVLDRLDRALHAALGGADDDGGTGGKDALGKQVGAEAVRQVDVEQRKVERQRLDHAARLVERADGGHVGVVLLERGGHLFAQEQLVLDQQHAGTLQGGIRHAPNVGEARLRRHQKMRPLGQALRACAPLGQAVWFFANFFTS